MEIGEGRPRIEKGTRHVPPSRTPKAHKQGGTGGHYVPDRLTSSVLPDTQIEEDFLATFAPLPEPLAPVPQQETEPTLEPNQRQSEKTTTDEKPRMRILHVPEGVILTDRETGEDAGVLHRDSDILGYWQRPPKAEGPNEGPALFIPTAMFPNGLKGKRVRVSDISIIRRGLLWNGQTSEDLERIKRKRERRRQSTK